MKKSIIFICMLSCMPCRKAQADEYGIYDVTSYLAQIAQTESLLICVESHTGKILKSNDNASQDFTRVKYLSMLAKSKVTKFDTVYALNEAFDNAEAIYYETGKVVLVEQSYPRFPSNKEYVFRKNVLINRFSGDLNRLSEELRLQGISIRFSSFESETFNSSSQNDLRSPIKVQITPPLLIIDRYEGNLRDLIVLCCKKLKSVKGYFSMYDIENKHITIKWLTVK